MHIKRKLQLSDESSLHVRWFGSGEFVRLYQGALSWCLDQGISVQVKSRRSKSLEDGVLLFADFDVRVLLGDLKARGYSLEWMGWGYSLSLLCPRDFSRERSWLSEQLQLGISKRCRSSITGVEEIQDGPRLILEELLRWPVSELPPIQASKAIKRWQLRLRNISLQ